MQFIVPGLKYDIHTQLTVPQVLLKKGFFCLPIRTSCFIISALSLVTSLILMSGLFATIAENDLNDAKDDGFVMIVSFLFCAVILDIIASTLLFFGSLKRQKSLVIPYTTLNFILISMGFLAMGIGIFKVNITWWDAAISIAVQGISVYVWMIVVSYYQIISNTNLAEKLVE